MNNTINKFISFWILKNKLNYVQQLKQRKKKHGIETKQYKLIEPSNFNECSNLRETIKWTCGIYWYFFVGKKWCCKSKRQICKTMTFFLVRISDDKMYNLDGLETEWLVYSMLCYHTFDMLYIVQFGQCTRINYFSWFGCICLIVGGVVVFYFE